MEEIKSTEDMTTAEREKVMIQSGSRTQGGGGGGGYGIGKLHNVIRF